MNAPQEPPFPQFRRIREQLGMSQAAMARELGFSSQSGVLRYDLGQSEVLPETARRLIALGRSRGLRLSFEDIYGPPAPVDQPLPAEGRGRHAAALHAAAVRLERAVDRASATLEQLSQPQQQSASAGR